MTSKPVTRAQVVAEARKWIGTPWMHQGRAHGVGVDCGGVVLEVGRALGLLGADVVRTNYARRPDWPEMARTLAALFDRASVAEFLPGRILVFQFVREPQHLGLCTGEGVVHAYAQVRAVVEHRLDDVWRARIQSAWDYRGLSDG